MPVLTASIPLDDASVVGELAGDEQDRKIEIMLTPSNLALNRYISELARIRMGVETCLS